jgi:hypothetical protein
VSAGAGDPEPALRTVTIAEVRAILAEDERTK